MGGQHIDESAVFGSTAEAHAGFMDAIWGPGINIVIILTFYSYRKWWGIIHGIFGGFACIYTLATSLPILSYTGIISKDSTQNLKYSAQALNSHYLVGIACMAVILIQTIMGVITKLMYYCSAKSTTIISMKKTHAIFGYIIMALCKSNYFIIHQRDGGLWFLVVQDIIFLILLIILKFKFPKMEAKTNQLPEENQVKSIKSVKQLDHSKDYAVFANYVYDIEPLKNYHPAGYQIVESVKNKEIDRYIYGMFASQSLPQVPIYSHSFKSFTLVGPPLAKITIPTTFRGFTKDQESVQISSLKMVSQPGQIYEMKLLKQSGSFSFEKYTSVVQLGRFYSLAINEQTTRLYTSVNFLMRSNKLFMKKNLEGFSDDYGQYMRLHQQIQAPQKTNTELMEKYSEAYVPILFKRYVGGKLTDILASGGVKSLTLSCPKGEGLQFGRLQPGRVIIVAGGTGLYPFSDLIDLLFKDVLQREKPSLAKEVIELSPLLSDNPLTSFSFVLLAAFNSIDDLHPITRKQISFLCSRGRLTLTLKVKDLHKDCLNKEFPLANAVENGFQAQLEKELKKGAFSKVWVCGPPKMNEGITKFLKDIGINEDNYLIL